MCQRQTLVFQTCKQNFSVYFFIFSSLIVTLQTIYPNSEILRLFHRNLTGYCLFAFHSDKASVSRLGKKLFPQSSAWFMNAYEHAISSTKNGYLYIDTSNTSGLKEKFRIRNFLTPVYPKTVALTNSEDEDLTKNNDYRRQKIVAVAKKDHQFLYSDLATDSPTY